MRPSAELPLTLDREGGGPLAGQLAAQLRAAMAGGRLAPGERLASTRALAVQLGISRTVVSNAYLQLLAEGWVEGRQGSGTYVAGGARAAGAGAAAAGPAGAVTGNGRAALAAGGPAAGAGVATASSGGVAVAGAGVATASSGGAAAASGDVLAASGDVLALSQDDPVLGEGDPAAGKDDPAGEPPLIDLRPGRPWTAGIDAAAWRRAWRAASRATPSAWPAAAGLPELRQALASYLRRSRGVCCSPAQVLITRGVAGGLGRLAQALVSPGDRVGVEEPGYPAARAVFAAFGARVVPCRADEHGLVTSELPGGLRMVYTTPAHQYPLGGRLPVPRRQELVAWARATGTLIVEDDYDSEFRYDVAPLPTLYGLGPDVVAYLGTTSKTLTPALGLGWLVASAGLVRRLAQTGLGLGERVPEPGQRALLALLASGDLERHIWRMRHEYARRRAALVAALGAASRPAGRDDKAGPAGGQGRQRRSGPGTGVVLLGDTAGMHLVLELPPGTACRAAAAARQAGVAAATLDRYYAGTPAREGLVLGYGQATTGQIEQACGILLGVLAGLQPG